MVNMKAKLVNIKKFISVYLNFKLNRRIIHNSASSYITNLW